MDMFKDLFNFKGKVAIITGASSGLGADVARAYAAQGADVALLARRKDKLDSVVKEIEATGKKAFAVQCDVTKEVDVKKAVETVLSHYGKIDILCNNAGTAILGSVEDLTVEEWDKVMDTNLKSIYLMCKYVVPQMRKQNYGRIVNVTSGNAIVADKEEPLIRHVYNASKSGVLGLTIGMAASLAKYGITVNAVGPGLFPSEMTANTLFTNENFLNLYNSVCPSSRPGRDGEVNGAILFFSSEGCSYTTGQFIVVDGGFTLV